MARMNDPSERAISLIRSARRIVAFSGAGISTEAGIPDFRSPEGIYSNSDAMEWLSASGFRRNPAAFYRASLDLVSTIARAEPTDAHRLLVRLEELGKLEAVVTQNIDGLHSAAGSTRVFELHGTWRTGRCTACGARHDMAPFYAEIEKGRIEIPACVSCAAPVKPDIVLFEELLPAEAWQGAVAAVGRCDLMLVMGSSLLVYPAAELPMMAVSAGAHLVIVNLEETACDRAAAAAVRARLGEFARAALAALGPIPPAAPAS